MWNSITRCNHGWEDFDDGCWACVRREYKRRFWHGFVTGLLVGMATIAYGALLLQGWLL